MLSAGSHGIHKCHECHPPQVITWHHLQSEESVGSVTVMLTDSRDSGKLCRYRKRVPYHDHMWRKAGFPDLKEMEKTLACFGYISH